MRSFLTNVLLGLLVISLNWQGAGAVEIKDDHEICKEALSMRIYDRRNALVRIKAAEGYSTFLLKRPKANTVPEHYVAIIFEGNADPKAQKGVKNPIDHAKSAAGIKEDLKDLDATVVSPDKIPFHGRHVIIDSARDPKWSRSKVILESLEGIFRIAPLATLFLSPYILGRPASEEMILSADFLALNFGMMAFSWWLFPDISTRISKKDLEVYNRTGEKSESIQKVLEGSPFTRMERFNILQMLYAKINEELVNLKSDSGVPVVAVIATADLADHLLSTLLDHGYLPSDFTETEGND